jgi:DNA-binding MarR family transcriptional regulator
MDNTSHIGVLIRKPYFEIMDRLYLQLQDEGYEGSNVMYSSIFQFIEDGKNLTELARLTNTSKQHVRFLLGNLAKIGYVQKHNDPSDGRAVIYSLTVKGEARRARSLEILENIEREWEDLIGKEEITTLRQILKQLVYVLTTNEAKS